MNRRRFLATTTGAATATAAAGLSAASLLHAAPAPAPTPAPRRIPIGFLGATYSHGPDKIKLAMRSADWQLVGVCDPSPAGREICKRLNATLISRDELFARAEVVAVESEIRDHAGHALQALKAGRHVHLEKPPVTKLSQMRALVALARRKQRLLQTGYMWRYHPGFRAMIEAAKAGWLGDVFLVRGYTSNSLSPARRLEWAEFPGGSMFELGSHLVDAAVRLLGRPKAVTPFLRRHGLFNDALADNNVAVLEFERAQAVLINTALQAGSTPPRSFEILGTKGTAVLQPIEPPTLTIDLTEPAGPYRKGPQAVSLPPYQRYEGDFAELAAAVRGERPLSVSLDEELASAETLLLASAM